MKFIIGLALLITFSASGQILSPIVATSPTAAAPSCTTQADQQTGTTHAIANAVGDLATHTYGAFAFTAGSTYTACGVTLRMNKAGSPTWTANAYIYTDSTNNPGTLVGTGSSNFSVSTLSTSEGDAVFTGLSASLTSGTKYWIVVKATGSANNSTDYINWADLGTATATDIYRVSTNGTAWSSGNTFVQGKLTTFK